MYKQALKHLLGYTTSRQADHLGFNASDRNAAQTLLKRAVWSAKDWERASELCYKYRVQLARAGFQVEEGRVTGARTNYQCAIMRETQSQIEVYIFTSRRAVWLDRDRIAVRRTGTVLMGTRSLTKAIVTVPQGMAMKQLKFAKAA